MAVLGELWAGHVYGTNTGNLFLELDSDGPDISGTLRFMDTQFGVAVYHVTGRFDGKLHLKGTPQQPKPGVELGTLIAEADLTSEGSLRGKWSTSLGSGGVFQAFPHSPRNSARIGEHSGVVPEQIYSSNITLGAVRLNTAAIDELVQFVCRDFFAGRPVLTYVVRGNEVTKYFEDFKSDVDVPPELRYLKLTIQELEAHGINKMVVVELGARGENVVRVQGINESWVVGKAEATARMLREAEKTLVTTFKKFGLTLNTLILIAMVVTMPSIPLLMDRILFAAVILVLTHGLYWLHQRFIPNAVVSVKSNQPSLLRRLSPTVLSWVVAASASVAAALVYRWLTGGTP